MSNLPDDVTPQDIDDNFGEPETVRVVGIVSYEVEAEVPKHSTPHERREALAEAIENGEGDCVNIHIL